MTVRDALREGARALGELALSDRAPEVTALLDASLILADALSVDRARILSSGPEPLGEADLARFREGIAARSGGLPIAYIVGRKEFWGRDFAVDARVLVPRPDTETLVEAALEAGDAMRRERALRVHECCTGSGCVAIALALERADWAISASDLSEDALVVARANAATLVAAGRAGGPVAFAASDLLEAFSTRSGANGSFDLILANPPYVPTSEARALLARGWSEPLMALDGGPDGLEVLRRLVPEAASALAPGGALLVEADGGQAEEVARLFRASRLESVETRLDLGGRARVTIGRKAWTP